MGSHNMYCEARNIQEAERLRRDIDEDSKMLKLQLKFIMLKISGQLDIPL